MPHEIHVCIWFCFPFIFVVIYPDHVNDDIIVTDSIWSTHTRSATINWTYFFKLTTRKTLNSVLLIIIWDTSRLTEDSLDKGPIIGNVLSSRATTATAALWASHGMLAPSPPQWVGSTIKPAIIHIALVAHSRQGLIDNSPASHGFMWFCSWSAALFRGTWVYFPSPWFLDMDARKLASIFDDNRNPFTLRSSYHGCGSVISVKSACI